MGMYKRILILAEEGDRDAMLKIAEGCREGRDLQRALYWYGKLNKTKEIEEIKASLAEDTEEDIFS